MMVKVEYIGLILTGDLNVNLPGSLLKFCYHNSCSNEMALKVSEKFILVKKIFHD